MWAVILAWWLRKHFYFLRPARLTGRIVELQSRKNRDHLQEFFKVDSTGAVLVECSEDVFIERAGLAFREQRRVDGEKLATTQLTGGTVFLHTTMTFCYLFTVNIMLKMLNILLCSYI